MRRLGRQFLKWCGSSAIGFSTNIGTAVLLHEGLRVRTTWAVAIAYGVTWCVNFLLARHVVFGGKDRPWYQQAAKFAGTTIAFRLIEYALWYTLHRGLGLPYFVAQLCVSSLAFVGYFFFYRRFVFGSRRSLSSADHVEVERDESVFADDRDQAVSHNARHRELPR